MGYQLMRTLEIIAGAHMDKGDRNHWRYEMSGVPIFGDFIRAQDMHRSLYDYMENYGISWDEVKYPSLLPGAGSYIQAGTNAVRTGMEIAFVSRNLGRLYNVGYRPNRGYRGVEYG